MVFPLPAVPEIRVVRPLGMPPFAISSKPGIPVSNFSTELTSSMILFSFSESIGQLDFKPRENFFSV